MNGIKRRRWSGQHGLVVSKSAGLAIRRFWVQVLPLTTRWICNMVLTHFSQDKLSGWACERTWKSPHTRRCNTVSIYPEKNEGLLVVYKMEARRVQILGHAMWAANWLACHQLGFLHCLHSVYILCYFLLFTVFPSSTFMLNTLVPK